MPAQMRHELAIGSAAGGPNFSLKLFPEIVLVRSVGNSFVSLSLQTDGPTDWCTVEGGIVSSGWLKLIGASSVYAWGRAR